MCWTFIKLICVGYINADKTPNSIKLICLQILSSWYVSKFYQLDMCWTFIKLICLGFYQVDMTPVSSGFPSFPVSLGSSGDQKKQGFPKPFFSDSIFFRVRDFKVPGSQVSFLLDLSFVNFRIFNAYSTFHKWWFVDLLLSITLVFFLLTSLIEWSFSTLSSSVVSSCRLSLALWWFIFF